MNVTSEISAVVLAAGESKRMGTMKMLLPFRGMTMLENVLENIKAAGVKKITVVTGHEKEKLAAILEKNCVNYCFNYNYTDGMLSSVICGINNSDGNYTHVMIFQGDQPLISPSTIEELAVKSGKTTKGILIPVHEGKRGHPLVVSRRMTGLIELLDPSIGLKALSADFPDETVEVEVNDPGILKDFDTYDEYIRAINQTM